MNSSCHVPFVLELLEQFQRTLLGNLELDHAFMRGYGREDHRFPDDSLFGWRRPPDLSRYSPVHDIEAAESRTAISATVTAASCTQVFFVAVPHERPALRTPLRMFRLDKLRNAFPDVTAALANVLGYDLSGH